MFRKPKAKTSSNLGSRESLDSRTSSGKSPYSSSENVLEPNLTKRHFSFTVSVIGVVQCVTIPPVASEESNALLLEKIENAQIEGKLGVKGKEDVNLVISKHGIRIMTLPASGHVEDVKWRFPLHAIGQLLSYESSSSKYNLILAIGQVGKHVFDCHVLQCQNQEQSQAICFSLHKIFNSLSQKS